ncbi:MAG TPA: NFACT RNA binding domain-containing protein [Candidatus Nanoarchaeia archaeon]|nr:NFACT RNA binding domain-containing protein [Candidatus Nanoarchaeia archaeon]
MTLVEIDLHKSVEENASVYYEKAKKIKKKIEGAIHALQESESKLKKLEKDHTKEQEELSKVTVARPKEWYEKFRWFITSTGFFVIGGRDATTNEIIVKKHTDADDLVFHTDLAGSPFFVIKRKLIVPPYPSPPPTIDDKTLREVADATVSYSRTWRLGLSNSPVFYVKPDQVSKEAKAGEYLVKGAFMINGKTNYVDNKINCAIGILSDGKIMGGPVEAVKAHCNKYVPVIQGRDKASKVAKFIQKKIGGTLDEIIAVLPSGGVAVK